jgi:hypothetical protein
MRVVPRRSYPLVAGWEGDGADFTLLLDIAAAWNVALRSIRPDEKSPRI